MDMHVHTANQNFLNNNRMERQGIREGVWSQGVQYSICKILTSHKIHLRILKALGINNKIVNVLKNLLIYIVGKRWITGLTVLRKQVEGIPLVFEAFEFSQIL